MSVHAAEKQPRLFGKGHPFQVEDLPDGELKKQLKKLSKEELKNALERLHKHTYSAEETASLRSDPHGMIYYACIQTPESKAMMRALTPPAAAPSSTTRSGVAQSNVPIASPPAYHSRPGCSKIIYLDFNGHVIQQTGWNESFNITKWDTYPFDLDGDETTFNDAEQTFMFHVWQRMAEDYAPFDVDVTTEEPAQITATVGCVVFTKNLDKNGNVLPHALSAGGIAFLDVFGQDYYGFFSPCFVYYENLPNYGSPSPPLPNPFEGLVAEAASHEMGHNLGLSHDGTNSAAYYGGHGSGNTSWGPIMGTGYGRNVSQWSKGEYFDANNTEDDLAILSGALSYRPDDHGNTNATASSFAVNGTTISGSNPKNQGVIEQNTDVDVFVFATEAGTVSFTINPFRSSTDTYGGNLDIHAELYNSSGGLEQVNSDPNDTVAFISKSLPAGVYYLYISGEGTGDPLNNPPSGYTNYGSLGQYSIDGTIVADTLAPTAVQSINDVTSYGGTTHTFTVTYSDNYGIDISSLDDNDIRISAPGGFDVPATFVSVDNASHGSPRVATYRFSAPGGFFDASDNNTYTATIQAGQVLDINGNAVATGTQTFAVNVPAFALTSVSGPANGTYKAGTNLDFNVTYTQPAVVTGTPSIGLTVGAASVNAQYISGTGTSVLTFRYTVQAGDTDVDGIASASPIALNGGTLKNSSGDDALLAFTPPNTTGVVVDTTAPNLISVTPPSDGTYGTNRFLDFIVNFSETVYVTGGTPSFALTIGSNPREATYVSGGGSTTLLFRYKAQLGESDSDGIVCSSPLFLNGAAIRDIAGNDATLTFTPPDMSGVLVNTVQPLILSVTAPADGEYLAGQNLDFIVHFDHVVYEGNGLPTINLTIGSASTNASYLSGSGTADFTFRHTVVSGEVDADGIACSSPIVLNGATIRDAAGNDAILTFTPPPLNAVIVNAAVARIIVTNANDSGAGSLRQAMFDISAGGIIDFDPTFFNVQRTINTTTSLTVSNKPIAINGPGSKYVTIANNNTSTVIVANNCDFTLIGLTISGGNGDKNNPGGQIAGAVTSSFNHNLTMIDCTVTGNHGRFAGGVYAHGTMTMRGCTITGNQAINPDSNSGGGVSMQGGSALIENCTFSGNTCSVATGGGGGFLNFSGTTNIVNCTITNNSCTGVFSTASGVNNFSTIYVFNSIIAGNVNSSVPDVVMGDTTSFSKGYNIIGNVGAIVAGGNHAANVFVNGTRGDQVGTPGNVLDPVIGALADNGGPTQTHLIQPNSKAYNTGSTISYPGTNGADIIAPILDQRDFARPRGIATDVGAVEAQLVISPPTIPNVLVNTVYSTVTFSVSGGTPAYILSFTGSLPAGMTCDGTTLAGTPTQVGDFPFTINATDSQNVSGSADYVLHVTNQPRDLIVDLSHTGNFTQGDVGATYTVTVTNNGSASTNASITATMDPLPTGLTATSFTGAGWSQLSLSPPTATFAGTLSAFESNDKLKLTVNVAANATTPLTPNVTVAGGGETNTANDSDNDPTIVIVNQAPTIAGTAVNQPVNDNATVALFNTVTIFDANDAQVLAVTVNVGDTTHGDLTAASVIASGFSNSGGGNYTFSGSSATTTAAIRQLVFAPIANRIAPTTTESTAFSITVSDAVAAPVTDNTTSVVTTSVNDAPSIAGTVASQTLNDTQTLAIFTGVTITDIDLQTLDISVTLDTAAKGTFTPGSLTASGFTNPSSGVYTFSGNAAASTTAIHQLVFAPTANRVAPGSTETTTFTLSVDDGIAAPATDNATTAVTTSINDAPVILGVNAGQIVFDNQTLPPFDIVILRDVDNPAQTLAVSVTLDDAAKGTFSAPSLSASGFADAGGGVYTFSGTTTEATAAIRMLIYVPTPNRVAPGDSETTTFTIFVDDGVAPAVTNNITTVVATSVNNAPIINGAQINQAVNDDQTLAPFGNVSIADVDVPAQTLAVSVKLDSAAKGVITAASLTSAGFTDAGGGTYTFSGTAAQSTTAIRQLIFAPTTNHLAPGVTETTTFTISADDGQAAAVTNSTTSVIATSVNDAPTITGAAPSPGINDKQTITTFSAVTFGDVDVPAQTLAIRVTLDNAAKGAFTGASLTASGFSDAGGGVYTFSGTAALATTAIRQLVFTPAQNRVAPGNTETTTLTISADDSIAAAVTNNATTVTTTSVNDAPTVSGALAGQTVNDNQTLSPFSGLTLGDVDSPAQTLAISVTLSSTAKGTFTTASLTASGFTDAGGGVYNFSGTPSTATTAIRKLTFAPTTNHIAPGTTETTTFTLSVNDGIASAVLNNTTTVIATSVNDAPTISGAVANQTITDNETLAAFSAVTIADVDVPAQTLSIAVALDTAAKGSMTSTSLTASGFTAASAGTYAFSGTAAQATTAIRKLVFAPAPGRLVSGTTEKTAFTISANDGVAPAVNDSTTSVISSAAPIVITSPATATPPNAGTGQTVTYSVGISGGSGTVTYTWDFGDGSPTATGSTVTHVYPVEGTYTTTVTVSDAAGGFASSSVTVSAAAPLIGEGPDSDGDGVSDDVETELGTSPSDATSTPLGAALSPDIFQPLNITKAMVKLNFAKPLSDSLSISGTLHIYANFNPAGKRASMIVGNIVRAWDLNAKGQAKTLDSAFKLQIKAKKKVVLEQDAKFTASFKKVPLVAPLANALKNADAKNLSSSVTFNLIMNQIVYRKVQPLTYSAKKDKSLMAKNPKVKK